MNKVIAGFDVQLYSGELVAWSVPITLMDKVPNESNIDSFTLEVDRVTEKHRVLNCYMICDTQLNVLYQDSNLYMNDIISAFDVLKDK